MNNTMLRLTEFFREKDSVILFAGAGVSVRAGLPTWGGLLEKLALICKSHQPKLCDAIIESVERKRYVAAATQYMSADILKADKYDAIRKLLVGYEVEKLFCLADLPFKGAVTTNYDRALLDAFAKQRKSAPIDYFHPDPSIGSIPFEKEFFVGRLHGRVENIDSIVLDEMSYRELRNNKAYEDALRDIFSRHNLLFIGFSFFDPAIEHVLSKISSTVSTIQSGRHLALLPSDSQAMFVREFSDRNIRVETYSPDNGHEELWKALCQVKGELEKEKKPSPAPHDPFADTRLYLASCYARFKLGKHLHSLRDVIIQGILSTEIIQKSGHCNIDELAPTIASILAIRSDEAQHLVIKAMQQLKEAGVCNEVDGHFRWTGPKDQGHVQHLELLSAGIANRVVVRESIKLNEQQIAHLPKIVEDLIVVRGWDLGAAFASNKFPTQINVASLIGKRRVPSGFPIQAATRAIQSLLINPEPREATALFELGRVAFALELVVKSPRDAELHSATLPNRIYLDSNVLMPSIVEGHAYKNVYEKTINALVKAADNAKVETEVLANRVVLEEILSHRHKGIEEVRSARKIDKNALRNEVLFYGSENINVFKAGYAGVLARMQSLEFDEYIRNYANYSSQQELERYLNTKGIYVLNKPLGTSFGKLYSDILTDLEKGYNTLPPSERKHQLLIPHDALQLAVLNTDIENGKRSIFVTADRTLRELVGNSRYSALANYMISNVGLTNLIDLVVGFEDDSPGAAKLMWGTAVTEHAEQIRNYLVNLALNQYNAAMASKMGKIVDDVTEDFIFAAENENVSLDSHRKEDRKHIEALLEQFENRFFEKMKAEMAKSMS